MSEVKPVRLQLSRRKGFSLQALSLETNGLRAVNVTRQGAYGGLFGNPWKIDSTIGQSREQVVAMHRVWITCEAGDTDIGEKAAAHRYSVLRLLPELRGKNLACTCPPPTDPYERDCCHAVVLIELANPFPATTGGR